MNLPRLAILDRDGVLNYASRAPSSPIYYILSQDALVLKPGVLEAVKLLAIHSIPMVLATKQKCVSKKLLTRDELFNINEALETKLGIQFQAVYTEEVEDTKAGLYREILARFEVSPTDTVLFDDSATERGEASKLGISAYDGENLLESVTTLLHL